MLLSFFRSAFRHLRRNPFYTTVNVLGLALALACVLAIAGYVRTELSYDRFHDDAERIVRIATRSDGGSSAATPRPLAGALETHVPTVETAARLSRERADRVLVAHEDRRFFESGFLFADPDVFDVLTIPLHAGDPDHALTDPFSIVISEAVAAKYFPDKDPIGQTLEIRLQGDRDLFEYTVTGIARAFRGPSHLTFDFLAAYDGHPMVGEPEDQDNWLGLNVYTYARLSGSPDELARTLPEFASAHVAPAVQSQAAALEGEGFGDYAFSVQPLRSIHLHSNLQDELQPNGSIQNVLIFSAVAFFILMLACINFVNLTTARASLRAREIGIRKVLGSARRDVALQFFIEAVLITAVAITLGLLVLGLAPRFLDVSWSQLDLLDPATALFVGALLFVVGIGSGAYPAVYLSSLHPSAALRSEGGFLRGSRFRRALVVVQLAVTTTLLICTAVVALQMKHVREADLGFDRSAVVVIEGAEIVRHRIDAFKQTLRSHASITDAANSEAVPGHALSRAQITGREDPTAQASVEAMTIGFGFIETMGMDVIAGRTFSSEVASDSMAVVLNETAAELLAGSPQAAVGMELLHEGRTYGVIGVVADYHQTSLRTPIGPTALFGPDPWNENRPHQVVAVRIRPDELSAAMEHLASVWSAFAPSDPLRYTFMDARLEAQYRRERADARYFATFSILAVAIACFGLIGLAGFTTETRSREIGIRKVHGATTLGVIRLFILQFLKLTAAAYLIAIPAGYVVMRIWLNRFAYSIAIDPVPFLYGGGLTLLVVLGATAYQVVRASRMNPVEVLKT